MASSHNHFFWSPDEPTASLTLPSTGSLPPPSSAPMSVVPTLQADSTPPHSPNDLSAAAILATLADSRPPTSHGNHFETMDDAEAGGIALNATNDEAPWAYEQTALGTLPVLQHFNNAIQSSAGSTFPGLLDQHSATLNPLSMEPLPALTTSTPALQDLLVSQNNIYEMDFESGPHPQDEFLSVTGQDSFLSISTFFRHFMLHKTTPIDLNATAPPEVIARDDLRGDQCDMQGIDWTFRHTSRAIVRAKRSAFETDRLVPQVAEIRKNIEATPNTESYFSFKRINTAHQAFIPHFQLRNLIATTSHNDIFYADKDVVLRTDTSGTPAITVQNLTKELTDGRRVSITTLAACDDILIAGGFDGEYALTNLSSSLDTPTTIGRIHNRARDSQSHITNHIHMCRSRTNYAPQAVLASNDNQLRVLDVHTNSFTHCFSYPQAVNCSATSPDGRMRIVVGDFRETLITNAETNQPLQAMKIHTDDAFACDWSDDGIHVATAAQDSTIVIWDARNWSRPLKIMRSELSISRCLRFSPVGGGPRVLISAEADDYLSVINAQTFESRQVFDFFGRIGGISLTPDGSSLFVANSEPHFGGIMEFDRCGWAEHRPTPFDNSFISHDVVPDWDHEPGISFNDRFQSSWAERERRGINLGELAV